MIGVTHYRRTGRYEAHIWISGRDAEGFEREGRDGEGVGGEGPSSSRREKKKGDSGGGGVDSGSGAQREERSRGYQLHLVRR